MKWTTFILSSVLVVCSSAYADEAAIAKHVLKLANRRTGVCEMPAAGDGKMAAAIAHNSRFIVHALASDAKRLKQIQTLADEAGLLGRTMYVEQSIAGKHVLADWCADLVLVTDASDAELARLSAREIRRICAPYRGVVVVGRAKDFGPGLTRNRLMEWARGLDAPDLNIIDDEMGLWATATMPPLPGGDDWTHYAHGPDQNRYSRDTTLRPPYLLQWSGKPYTDGKFDMVVAAGGRIFHANPTLSIDGTSWEGITARSIYNGSILWHKDTAGDFGTFGSLIAATSETVYLKDGNAVLCLDAETGKQQRRIVLSEDPQTECRWLMLEDGILVTILGPRPPVPQGKQLVDLFKSIPVERWGRSRGVMGTLEERMRTKRNHAAAHDWFQDYDRAVQLLALDAASGELLWKQDTPGIDPAKTAISAGRLFFYAERSYAACLDLRTGKQKWKTHAPIAKKPRGSGFSITFMVTYRVGALASPDVYMVNSYKDGHYQTFSAKDGKLLWGEGRGRTDKTPEREDVLGSRSYPVLMDGKIIEKGGRFYDVMTGKPTGTPLPIPPHLWGGCGAFCVTPKAVHSMSGTCYDLESQVPIPGHLEFKAACLPSVIPANGVLVSSPGNCRGCPEWIGYHAFRSAAGIPLDNEDLRQGRLLSVKTMGKAELQATAGDWTTYRRDYSRCGSSPAQLVAGADVSWTWTPAPPFDSKAEVDTGLETQSTQTINVGERIFFGAADGVIRCLDRKSGRELWNFATAGRIISAPSFWEGRLYAGSGDGRVYCLDAGDGSLVWQYRVAPIERRIMAFSHLMSAWPVNANVLVQVVDREGKAAAMVFATAGLLGSAGGSYMCGLDARTGKPHWEVALHEALKAEDGKGTSLTPAGTGQMAWYDGRIWLHAGYSGVFIIDPANGRILRAIDFDKIGQHQKIRTMTNRAFRGQDIGILPGGWVVLGGKQIYNDPTYPEQPRNLCAFLRAEPGHVPLIEGYPDLIILPELNGSSHLPVWDEAETLLLAYKRRRVSPVYCAGLADHLETERVAHPFDPEKSAANFWNAGLQNRIVSEYPQDRQRQVLNDETETRDFITPLLAANATVFFDQVHQTWHVVAVDRTDTSLLWDHPLPEQPLFGGLSCTGAGDVLVPLLDGRIVCIGGDGR